MLYQSRFSSVFGRPPALAAIGMFALFAVHSLGWLGTVCRVRGFEPTRFTVRVTGQGPPVVLIPGLTCDGSVWQATVERFKQDYELHVVSLAGFGEQSPVAGELLPKAREELAAYIKDRGLERPVLVGHSLGGFLALWVACEAPDLVGGVVSVDGVPFLPDLQQPEATVDSVRKIASTVRQQFASLDAKSFAAQNKMMLSMLVGDSKQAERIGEMTSKSDPATVGRAMYELMTNDLRPLVRRIRVPVLTLIPADSGVPGIRSATLQKRYRAQLSTISHCEVKFVEQTRHFIMIDQPEAFYEYLGHFFRSCRPSRRDVASGRRSP